MTMTDAGTQDPVALARESIRRDVETLLAVKEKAQNKVLDDPCRANIEAFERASRALDASIGGPAEDDPLFDNRIEVLKHLQAEGYKVKKSKLYQDAKDGLLRLQPDGRVKLSDVKGYIRRARIEKLPDLSAAGGGDLFTRKATAEIEKLNEQIEELRFKREVNRGRYVLKEEVEMELAARATVFEAALRHMVDSQVGEWIRTVSGDPAKAQDLRELIHDRLNDMLNEFVSLDYFHVIIVGEEEGSTDE